MRELRRWLALLVALLAAAVHAARVTHARSANETRWVPSADRAPEPPAAASWLQTEEMTRVGVDAASGLASSSYSEPYSDADRSALMAARFMQHSEVRATAAAVEGLVEAAESGEGQSTARRRAAAGGSDRGQGAPLSSLERDAASLRELDSAVDAERIELADHWQKHGRGWRTWAPRDIKPAYEKEEKLQRATFKGLTDLNNPKLNPWDDDAPEIMDPDKADDDKPQGEKPLEWRQRPDQNDGGGQSRGAVDKIAATTYEVGRYKVGQQCMHAASANYRNSKRLVITFMNNRFGWRMPPIVLATVQKPRTLEAWDHAYQANLIDVTPFGFVAEISRLDSDNGWCYELDLHWMAYGFAVGNEQGRGGGGGGGVGGVLGGVLGGLGGLGPSSGDEEGVGPTSPEAALQEGAETLGKGAAAAKNYGTDFQKGYTDRKEAKEPAGGGEDAATSPDLDSLLPAEVKALLPADLKAELAAGTLSAGELQRRLPPEVKALLPADVKEQLSALDSPAQETDGEEEDDYSLPVTVERATLSPKSVNAHFAWGNYDPHNPLQIEPNEKREDNYFLILGDWGKDFRPGPCQSAVAQKMVSYMNAQAGQGKKLLFVAAVGNNFYWSGAKADHLGWKTMWQTPYGEVAKVPWLAVLGNHDYGDNDVYMACPEVKPKVRVKGGTAQHCPCEEGDGTAYAGNQMNADKNPGRPADTANYWLPDYNYHYLIEHPGWGEGNGLEVIAVDTNVVDLHALGGAPSGHVKTDKACGGIDGPVKAFLQKLKERGEQLLQSRAAESPARTVLIMQHYPSEGYRLKELFEGANGGRAEAISAYGHVHNQNCDHAAGEKGCDQIMSGGGGGCCEGDLPSSRAGFAACHLTADSFHCDVDSDAVRINPGKPGYPCTW